MKKTLVNPLAKNIIGKKVQEARLKFNPPLSQDELAIRLELAGWKISRGTLAKIEAGIREVRDYEIVILAKTLKVEVGGVVVEWRVSKKY